MRSFKFYGVAAYGIVLALGGLALASPSEGGCHLLNQYALGAVPGGQEYWDYIAFGAATRRLYISDNTEVEVVDTDSGKVVGDIPNLKRAHCGLTQATADADLRNLPPAGLRALTPPCFAIVQKQCAF